MTPINLQNLIAQAIVDGINMKLLYITTGLDFSEFNKYHRDCLFTHEQENDLIQVIKEWRDGV